MWTKQARTGGSCRSGTKESSRRLSRLLAKYSSSSSGSGISTERPCAELSKDCPKKYGVRVREMTRAFKLTGTEAPSAKCACLQLLGSSTKGGRCLGLRLTKGSSSGTKRTSTCDRGAFKVTIARTSLKREIHTESPGGGLLTESKVTCAEEATGLLLRLLLRLCGTEAASTEAGRLLWLSLTKHTKPGPGLMLLLAKCVKSRSGSCASRPESVSTAAESRFCGPCCGLGPAEQAPSCRVKRIGAKSSRSSRLTILLVVL